MDLHEAVSILKDLAIELQRTPRRFEYESKIKGGKSLIDRAGGYMVMCRQAGLDAYDEVRKSPLASGRELFRADIEEVVSSHKPKIIERSTDIFEPILVIGDSHFPFAHQPTLERIYRFAEIHKPAHIIQMGDLQDQFSHSRFPASRNYYSPDQEMSLAREQSMAFWRELKKAAPKAKCYQITGNHDVRALKAVLQSAPSLETLVRESLHKLYEFDGVETIHDYREELIIQGIMFHHGFMGKHGDQMNFVLQSLVSAHTHRAGIVYRQLADKIIFHLNPGFVGDAESKAMSYTPMKTTGWTLSWGFIDEYGPRVIT